MNLIQRIIQVSNLCPDAIAVVDERKSYTYREIEEHSNAIAHHLVAHLHSDAFRCVAILLPRSAEVIEAYLGIIKADACVMCINDSCISTREMDIIGECAPEVIVTTKAELTRFPEIAALSCHKLLLDEQQWSEEDYMPINLSVDAHPAHVTFTSGTTGRPKGVVYSLSNRSYFVHPRITEELPLEPSMRQVCLMDLSYTMGTAAILRPMIAGGTAYIAPAQLLNDIPALVSFTRRHSINRIFLPNSVVPLLLREPNHGIKHILSSCERLEGVTPEMLQGVLLENLYGATETGRITKYRVVGNETVMPIGRADDLVSIFLLDDQGVPVAQGQVGEIYVSSPIVAMGYLNDEALTRERFLPCPFLPGERMYRTGDYAFCNEDGQFIYCGRQDGLVKIRGYRIHLGEIENAALMLKTVRQAVVKLFDEKLLCLYYTGEEDLEAIKEHLRRKLPPYMMPHQMIHMASLPLRKNGKIDRARLEKPSMCAHVSNQYSSETERMLCYSMGEVLDIDPMYINPNDDFFDLGGDSLSAMKWINRIHSDKLSFATLYAHRTPHEIAKYLDQQKVQTETESSDEAARRCWQPFNTTMRDMFACQQVYPNATMWNVAQLYRLADEVDVAKLTTVVERVCRHHPVMNSVVERRGEVYGFRYLEESQPVIENILVKESAAAYIAKQQYSFSLENGKPLYRIVVLNALDGCFLFIVAHHLIMDGYSLSILHSEIEQAYRGEELPRDYFFSYLQQQADSHSLPEYGTVCKTIRESLFSADFQYSIPPVCNSNDNHLAVYHHPLSIQRAPGNRELMAASLRAVAQMSGCSKIRLNWTFHNRQNATLLHSVGVFFKTYSVAADTTFPQEMWHDTIHSQMDIQIANSRYDYEFCGEVEEPFISDSIEMNCLLPLMEQQVPAGRLLTPVITPQTNHAASIRMEVDVIANAGQLELSVQYMTPQYDETSVRQFCQWIDHFLQY